MGLISPAMRPALSVDESRTLARRRAVCALLDGKRRSPLAAEAWEAWRLRARRSFAPSLWQFVDSAIAMAPGVLLPPAADEVDHAAGMSGGEYEPGVPAWWPADPAPMPLGAVRATVGAKYWEPDPSGAWLATLPVYEAAEPPMWQWGEETVTPWPRSLIPGDVVAWNPRDPSKWWAREGGLDILGARYVEEQLARRKPVRVVGTPAAWNAAGGATGRTACVLRWSSPGLPRRMLIEAVGLIGDSTEHGEFLRKKAARTLPAIYVTERQIKSAGTSAGRNAPTAAESQITPLAQSHP